MTLKKNNVFLSSFHFLVAAVFIYGSIQIMQGSLGEYPIEWLQKLPFTSWFLPGLLIFVFFGIGHLVLAGISLMKEKKSVLLY